MKNLVIEGCCESTLEGWFVNNMHLVLKNISGLYIKNDEIHNYIKK